MQHHELAALSDAQDAVEHFSDEIVEHLVDNGQVSIHPLNDLKGFDEYHHETHVDAEYGLIEAASLLDQLDQYEETDSGLWDGLEPRRAISAQAAYTFGNAVLSMICDLLKQVQDDETIAALLVEHAKVEDSLNDLDDETDYTLENERVTKSLKERVEQLARGES